MFVDGHCRGLPSGWRGGMSGEGTPSKGGAISGLPFSKSSISTTLSYVAGRKCSMSGLGIGLCCNEAQVGTGRTMGQAVSNMCAGWLGETATPGMHQQE